MNKSYVSNEWSRLINAEHVLAVKHQNYEKELEKQKQSYLKSELEQQIHEKNQHKKEEKELETLENNCIFHRTNTSLTNFPTFQYRPMRKPSPFQYQNGYSSASFNPIIEPDNQSAQFLKTSISQIGLNGHKIQQPKSFLPESKPNLINPQQSKQEKICEMVENWEKAYKTRMDAKLQSENEAKEKKLSEHNLLLSQQIIKKRTLKKSQSDFEKNLDKVLVKREEEKFKKFKKSENSLKEMQKKEYFEELKSQVYKRIEERKKSIMEFTETEKQMNSGFLRKIEGNQDVNLVSVPGLQRNIVPVESSIKLNKFEKMTGNLGLREEKIAKHRIRKIQSLDPTRHDPISNPIGEYHDFCSPHFARGKGMALIKAGNAIVQS